MTGGVNCAPIRSDVALEASRRRIGALPPDWDILWGAVSPPRVDLRPIKQEIARLAGMVELIDCRKLFGGLVGSRELRDAPVHRWFSYKEGFSHALLGAVIQTLGLSRRDLQLVDTFGGVATTALTGRVHPQIREVRSLEYSPWACFAGATKLAWPTLEPGVLRALLPAAVDYDFDPGLRFPELAAFSNARIFHHRRVRSMLSAREHLRVLAGATVAERDFFLLGLGAVAEDLSYAMKDGRALRIKGTRRRRPSSLADHPRPAVRVPGRVRQALVGQWTAMIEDLESLGDQRARANATPAVHLRGDARNLDGVRMPDGRTPAFPNGWATLSCFSPPYLNCIDYTELYKIELWLMNHIATREQFRETRLGTLRSHPSVMFPARDSFRGVEDEPVVKLVAELSEWLTKHGRRRDVGPVVRTYFEDMLDVWRAQHALLGAGGVAICVVANSTFSRRERGADETPVESWRVPLLTDVLLAHLAELAGFRRTELWNARTLRPRNVRGGTAREALVVAYK
jgi:hypothetical protein